MLPHHALRRCGSSSSIISMARTFGAPVMEPQRRNAWCGSIGYLSLCGNMDTSITIRTITAWQGQLYCSAGGGIVADSEEAAEYQETFDKVNRILHQLES